jgi:hypothetical protein
MKYIVSNRKWHLVAVTVSLLLYAETNCHFVFNSGHFTGILRLSYGALCDAVRTSPSHSCLLKCCTLSQYTCGCNFIYTFKKSKTFPVPLFMEQHTVHPNQSKYRKHKYKFSDISEYVTAFTVTVFTKFSITW